MELHAGHGAQHRGAAVGGMGAVPIRARDGGVAGPTGRIRPVRHGMGGDPGQVAVSFLLPEGTAWTFRQVVSASCCARRTGRPLSDDGARRDRENALDHRHEGELLRSTGRMLSATGVKWRACTRSPVRAWQVSLLGGEPVERWTEPVAR